MLVTLANNQTIAANSSATYTYSPQSVQKVFLSVEDADWEAGRVTVQIGSKTICNGISLFGCKVLTTLTSGVQQTTDLSHVIVLDFGSHQCMGNDNLYVTVSAGSGALSNTDASAIVDEPFSGSMPVRLTEYSDTTFSANNVIGAVSYDSAMAEVNEDDYNCEIKTSLYSSAPSFISANSYYQANALTDTLNTLAGMLCNHQAPLHTTFNYSASAVTDRIITSEAMGSTSAQIQKAKNTARIAKAAVGK